MTQDEYREIALDTLQLCTQEYYNVITNNFVFKVEMKQNIQRMIQNTKVYKSDEDVIFTKQSNISKANYFVKNETTIHSVLDTFKNLDNVCILNFASAIKAGGGWLKGRNAQEEDIMRKTNLFPSLVIQDDFYKVHDKNNPFYSHSMIYTPNVLVIKDDDYNLIKPKTINVITSAAINLSEIKKSLALSNLVNQMNLQGHSNIIETLMLTRMEKILKIAIQNNVENIVLGAFGCGVFGHDARNIAKLWIYLLKNKQYDYYFKNIMFAVLDNSPMKYNYETFENAFVHHFL